MSITGKQLPKLMSINDKQTSTCMCMCLNNCVLYVWYRHWFGGFYNFPLEFSNVLSMFCLPFWSTWVHPRFLVGFVLLDL